MTINLTHRLESLVRRADPSAEHPWDDVVKCLIDIWLDDYRCTNESDVVLTGVAGFRYLFDVGAERLIAAFGTSKGKHTGPRPAARMKESPLSDGPRYHRGHAIPHTLGGPADINLVPQLGKINIGDFRRLEIEAVATPGALYFTWWRYSGALSQRPVSVEQGLLTPGGDVRIKTHSNVPRKHRPGNVEAFLKQLLPVAQNVKRAWHVPVSVTIAQAAQETGWGKKVIGNAYFGIKGTGRRANIVAFDTTEVFNGARTKLKANFRAYASLRDAADDYGRFLRETPRFAAAFRYIAQPVRFAGEIAKAGYATDPQYGQHLKDIIRSERLTDFDE